MSVFYPIWVLLYKLVYKYNTFVERLVFFSDYSYFYRNNSIYNISFFQKLFLIIFYDSSNFKNIKFFIKHLNLIHSVRLYNYTTIHNYMARYTANTGNKQNKLKTHFSVIKLNNISDVKSENEFYYSIVNILLLKTSIYNMFWEIPQSHKNLSNYLKSSYSFMLVNTHTVKGFINLFNPMYSDSIDYKIAKNDLFFNNYVKVNKVLSSNISYNLVMRDFSKILNSYNSFYKKITNSFDKEFKSDPKDSYKTIFTKSLKKSLVIIESNFKKFYVSMYPIKYKPTDNASLLYNNKGIVSFFIRKNKIFNKGRYSRNRQLYRTGVYWCLWLNIINVFGLYYYFYRFVFNFGYFYLPLLVFILSIFGSRLVKYRFYNPINVINEFKLFLDIIVNFLKEIIYNFIIKTKQLIIKLIKYVYMYILYLFK